MSFGDSSSNIRFFVDQADLDKCAVWSVESLLVNEKDGCGFDEYHRFHRVRTCKKSD